MPALRKVQTRKLTLKLFSFLVVSVCRILFRFENPDVDVFSAKSDSRAPFSILIMPSNALEFADSLSTHFHIPLVLGAGCYTQILIAIVERISIRMISAFSISGGKTQYLPVHLDDAFSIAADCIEGAIIATVIGAPNKAIKLLEPVSANFNYLSTSQSYKSVVSRGLEDFWARLVWSCHNTNNNTFLKEAHLA